MPMNPADIVERLRKITLFDDQGRIAGFSSLLVISEAADEIERLRGRGVFGDDGVPHLLIPQTRAEIIEECAKVAEATGNAFWDDYSENAPPDHVAEAIRALAAQGKE